VVGAELAAMEMNTFLARLRIQSRVRLDGKGESTMSETYEVETIHRRARAAWAAKQESDATAKRLRADALFNEKRERLIVKVKETLQMVVDPASVRYYDKYIAVIDIDGLRFYYDNDNHGVRQLYLLGECPICLTQQSAKISSMATLGKQIEEFKPQYHTCGPLKSAEDPAPPLPTVEEDLMRALENFVYAKTFQG
jgi:hypothetical protein